MTDHVWAPRGKYIELRGSQDAVVRTVPMPNGKYLWQFRKVVSFADSLESAKDFVEAGAEFFSIMRRNPYR